MRGQRGFTLIEMLVAVAIAGLIAPAIVSAIFQMSRGSADIQSSLVVHQDIDVASSYFSRDLSQAMTTDLAGDGSTAPSMRVSWNDQTSWAATLGEPHCARYYIEPGTTLLKRNSDGASDCAVDGTVSIVGRHVADVRFSRSGDFITVLIKSSLGGQAQTLTYFVTARADGALP